MDVRNILLTMDGVEWKYDQCQAQSLRLFQQHNADLVHHYQEMGNGQGGSFEIVVIKPQSLELLAKFGHKRPLFLDSTFGTNNLKASIHKLCPSSV